MAQFPPSAALQVTPFKGPDFAGAYQRAQSLRDMSQQRQLRGLQIQGEQLDLEAAQRQRQTELTAAQQQQLWRATIAKHAKIEDGAPVFDDAAIQQEFIQAGAPELVSAYQDFKGKQADSFTKWQTFQNSQIQAEAAKLKAKTETWVGSGEKLLAKPKVNNAEAARWIADGLNSGFLDREDLPSGPTARYDPGFIRSAIDAQMARYRTAEERLKEREQAAKTGSEELKLSTAQREEAEKAKTEDQVAKDLGYTDFATAPKFIQNKIRQKKTGIDVTPPKEDENELIYAAYAQEKLKGKAVSDLTAIEKVSAKQWHQALSPEKRNEFEQKVALAKTDPELFALVMGGARLRPEDLTPKERADFILRARAASQDIGGRFDQKAYDALLQQLKDSAGIDLKQPAKQKDSDEQYGAIETRTLKTGGTVRVRKNLKTGLYETAP